MKFLLVALGSGIGGGLRYLISSLAYKFIPIIFPYGTLIVNVLGSILLGIILFSFDEKELLSTNLKLVLAVGFCGGFTTFSTFSYETFTLLKNSEYILAITFIFLNLVLTIFGVYLGYIFSK